MKYSLLIEESEEGFAVSVPGLPGCHSQGETEAEALENVADAIREYLEVARSRNDALGGRNPGEIPPPGVLLEVRPIVALRFGPPGHGPHRL